MIFKCPGSQRFSQSQPEIIACPHCGGEVEIWTDEITAKCPQCKKTVRREQQLTCLEWCKYAKECAGTEIYEKFLKNKRLNKNKK